MSTHQLVRRALLLSGTFVFLTNNCARHQRKLESNPDSNWSCSGRRTTFGDGSRRKSPPRHPVPISLSVRPKSHIKEFRDVNRLEIRWQALTFTE